MEENHAYQIVNKRTAPDIKDMEQCCAYGVGASRTLVIVIVLLLHCVILLGACIA